MIHVALVAANTQNISITLDLESQIEFYQLLQRALNCAPEFSKDWFELSDRLEQHIDKQTGRAR